MNKNDILKLKKQIKNESSIVLKLDGKPNARQREFFLSLARHTAYGGARGGGKSWAMRRKFVLLAFRYAGLKLLLMRRTLPELRENHTLQLQQELNGVVKYKDSEKVFIFPNGSRLKLGYCDNESDVLQYQGQEYDVIGLEEATHFTEYQRNFLMTCNRSVRSDFSPRMYYTGNPGGVGHAWFKRLFIDKDYRTGERGDDYLFIPAKVYDNPVLMQNNPEYVENLKSLPESLRRAHLDGDWDIFAGQYFAEFKRDRHVVKPFEIPRYWYKFRSMDYGMDMLACYFWAVDSDGVCYVYREIYQSGLNLSEAARMVVNATLSNEEIRYTVASPDLWNRRQESGFAGQEIMCNAGLKGLIKANDNRIAGWRAMREYLAGDTPRLKIFENCNNLIRCLPQLQFDKFKTEDVANTPHEITHAPESIRYGIMSRPVLSKSDDSGKFYTKTEREDLGMKNYGIRRVY
ncbi:MAG: phage terminase large subunit [Clostridiales bacterium]|jgi:phage terminase large subunit|nr:phage terminase large subunit [Clostridiales bacterium]